MKLLTIAVYLLLGGVAYAQQRIPVVIAAQASAVEVLAASELSRFLAKIYPGRTFPVGQALPEAGPAVLVGTPRSQPELRRLVVAKRLQGPESFVVSTVALLESHPNPTPEQARRALDGNICRCGTYARVLEAALNAKGVARG